ncbi:MAG: hypothetical protein Q8920_02350 [Bacillota bacterium]|nr:hypothetical protein [Bacillota bacterium]
MSRQAHPHEKILFDIIREYNNKFYYDDIYKLIDDEGFKIKLEKGKEEMVGKASVSFPNGDKADYEVRYNRIVNLSEGYTMLVPGSKAG